MLSRALTKHSRLHGLLRMPELAADAGVSLKKLGVQAVVGNKAKMVLERRTDLVTKFL